jgi:molybdate transport system ATP-binding protein
VTGALAAQVVVRRGDFVLEVALKARPGEPVALLGRNGAGKSTLLAALAGLLPIDEGRITMGERVLDDPDAARFVPPERRPVGVVLQSPALFPHLGVRDNVAFGLRAGGMRRAAARDAADAELDRHGLADLAGRRADRLSGGQAARVALVRALIRRPELLLLDEPLAAIDAADRPALRAQLAADLASFAGVALLVTHDVRDAEALAASVVVLDAGRVVQAGTLAELRAAPASPTVARLVDPQTSSTSPGASG